MNCGCKEVRKVKSCPETPIESTILTELRNLYDHLKACCEGLNLDTDSILANLGEMGEGDDIRTLIGALQTATDDILTSLGSSGGLGLPLRTLVQNLQTSVNTANSSLTTVLANIAIIDGIVDALAATKSVTGYGQATGTVTTATNSFLTGATLTIPANVSSISFRTGFLTENPGAYVAQGTISIAEPGGDVVFSGPAYAVGLLGTLSLGRGVYHTAGNWKAYSTGGNSWPNNVTVFASYVTGG